MSLLTKRLSAWSESTFRVYSSVHPGQQPASEPANLSCAVPPVCIFFKRDLTVLSCPLLSSPYIYIFLKYIYLWMYSSIWVNQIFQLWHVGSSSWPQIEPGPPALRVQSLSHWTTREVPPLHIFQSFSSTMAQHKSSISPLSSLAPQVALASFSELGNTDCSVPRKWLYW